MNHQMIVVSGLACGIDTAAHTAAIESGGKTIAVLGTPLDDTYPQENQALQSLIMAQHLAVSQFAPGAGTQPKNFPVRNRTMALLTDATVIVEAGEKSGTVHQGWEAGAAPWAAALPDGKCRHRSGALVAEGNDPLRRTGTVAG